MKLTRKLLSLLLAGTMVIGSAQPVNAAGGPTDEPFIIIDEDNETLGSSYASSDASVEEDEDDDASAGSGSAASSASSDDEIIIIVDDDEDNDDEEYEEESSDAASSASSDESSEAASLASSDESSDAASLASSEDEELEDEELPEDYYTVYPVGGVIEDESVFDIESASEGKRRGLLKATNLPTKYITPDLPYLRNQGKFGTCWSHAVNTLADISLMKNGYISDANMSELHLAYFTYNSVVDPLGGTEGDIVKLGNGQLGKGGNAVSGLRTYSRWIGAADESTVPYSKAASVNSTGLSTVYAYDDAAHVTSYYLEPVKDRSGNYVNDYTGVTLPNIKTLIKEYGAVYISFEAFDSMSASADDGVYSTKYNSYYNPVKTNSTNHAVAVVGWDDNFSKNNFVTAPPADGAFLIRNSWKEGTGKDTDYSYSGYFWMSYYEGSLGSAVYAAEFEPASFYDNNYQYDGGESVSTLPSEKNAVVFKTHASGGEIGEELGAIAFYTSTSNVNYKVEIYLNPTKENDPTSGEIVNSATTTGSTTFAGMHRVELRNAVPMEPNTTFAVVVTLEKSGETPSIGLEYSFNGDIACEANHGFYWLNNRWNDIKYYNSDLIIKAYTNNMESNGEGGDPTDISFTGIENGSLTLGVGEKDKIIATVLPYNATDRTVTWSSSDENVVTVTSTGVVTGISKGTATITVTTNAGNVTKTIKVNVINKLLDLSIDNAADVFNGETMTFVYVTSPENYSSTGSPRWSTSTPDTVKINAETGEAEFIKVGKASVSVTLDGKTDTADFYVYPGRDADYGYTVNDDNSVEIWWKGQDNGKSYTLSKNGTAIYTVDHSAGTKKYSYVDETHKDDFSSRYSDKYNISYDLGNLQIGTNFTVYTHRIYNITYQLNGGVQNPQNPSKYIYGKETPLYAPTKEGYVFAGWYTSSSFNKSYKVDSISEYESGNLTLYAKFVPEVREIKYVLNGGTQNPKNQTTYKIGETVKLYDPTPEKRYAFVGWFLGSTYGSKRTELTAEDTGLDGGDIVLYARFNRVYTNSISMTSVGDNGVDTAVPETISVGDTLTLSAKTGPVGADPGYTWKNYGTSTSPVYVNCTPSGAATATIDSDGRLKVTAVKSGSVVITVCSEEYSSKKDTRTIKITNPNERSITYVMGDHISKNSNSNPAAYVQGEETFLYDPYVDSYYEFQGWYLDAAFSPDKKRTKILATDSGDLTLYAKVIGAEKSITYYLYGGTQNDSNPKKYRIGESAQLYAPTPKKGYAFEGWYLDSSFTASKKVTSLSASYTETRTSGITLYANYVKVEVTGITLGTVVNGSFDANLPTVIDKGETIVLQAQVQPYGTDGLNTDYTWKNYGTSLKPVYAKGEPYGIVKTEIKDGNLLLTPTGKGVVEVTAISSDNKNITVTYSFTVENSKEAKVSYVLGGRGKRNDNKNLDVYDQGTEVTLYDPTPEAGFVFEGWYLDAAFSPDKKRTKILATDTGDLTLYAKFTGLERKITYVTNGGVQDEKNPTTYIVGETAQLYDLPHKKGYAFMGWYIKGEYSDEYKRTSLTETDTQSNPNGITLYAYYKRVNVKGIEIGSIVDGAYNTSVPQTLNKGETIELQARIRPYGTPGLNPDYSWKNYGSSTQPVYVKAVPAGSATAEIVDGNLVITALNKGTIEVTAISDDETVWKATKTFTVLNPKEKRITYSVGQNADANAQNPSYYEEGTTAQLYPAVAKRGYVFEGWFLDPDFSEDSKRTEILATDAGELTLYAKVSSTERAIAYVLGDGTQNDKNPARYFMGEEAQLFVPTAPVGYVFAGWYLDSEFGEESKRDKIQTTDAGDLTLYAKYEKVQVTGITVLKVNSKNGKTEANYSHTLEMNSPVILRAQVEPYGTEGLNTAYTWKNYGTAENPSYVGSSTEGTATARILSNGDLEITATGKGTFEVQAISADDETKTVTEEFKVINPDEPKVTGISIAYVNEFGDKLSDIPTELELGDTVTLNAQVEPFGAAGLNTVYYWKNYGSDENPVYAKMTPADAASVDVDDAGNLVIVAENAGEDSEAFVEVTAIPDGDETKAKTVKIKIVDFELQIISSGKTPVVYGSNKLTRSANTFTAFELATGKSMALKTRFLPAVSDKTIVWASSNPAIATVDAAGKVMARGAGSAEITATNRSGNAVARAQISVYDPVTSISLDKKAIKLGVDQEAKLTATTMPNTASDEVYFTTNKAGIVEVDDEGNIKATGAGTVVVTAKSAHGEKAATCTITVGNAVESIAVSPKNSKVVAAGKTLQMLATFNGGVSGNQPVNKDITWEIVNSVDAKGQEDNSVATINAKGVITGKKAGVISVIAKSTTDTDYDGSFIQSAPVDVYVYVPMSKASLNKTAVSLYTDRSYKLEAMLNPSVAGQTVTGLDVDEDGSLLFSDAKMEVEWKLKNQKDEEYLSLEDNGDGTCNVYALDYEDTRDKKVAVTATVKPYGAAKATVLTCNVSISKNAAISKLAVNPVNLKINRGADADISAVLTPMIPENSEIQWTIAEADTDVIAFVDEFGDEIGGNSITTSIMEDITDNTVRIRALSDGNANKTKAVINVETVGTNAKGQTIKAKVNVTIGNEANTIVISNGKKDVTWDAEYAASNDGKLVQVAKGKSVTLKAAAYKEFDPDNAKLCVKAGNQAVTWTSSDTSVATVSAAGKITALKAGQTWITAISKDIAYNGDDNVKVYARALVYVYAPATKATLDKTKATLGMEVDGQTNSSYRQYDALTMMTSDDIYSNPNTVSIEGADNIAVLGMNTVTWTVNTGAAGDEFIAVTKIPTAELTAVKNGADKQEVLGGLDDQYESLAKGGSFQTVAGESIAIKALKPGTVTLTGTTPGGKKASCTVTIYTHVQDVRLKLTWKNSEDGNVETLGSYSNPITKTVAVTEGKKKVNKSINILEEYDGFYDYVAKLDTKNNKSLKLTPVLDYYAGEDSCAYYYDRKTTALEKSASAFYTNTKKYAVNNVVNYRSSNPSVVAVAANGTITVKKVGVNQTASAVITISTADGSVQKRVLVKVRKTAADWVED